MAQTVIGFFEATAAAQQALQQLERMGIPRRQIDVSSRGAVGASGERDKSRHDRDEGSGHGIRQFFNSLFGNNSADAHRYTQVGNSGYAMVTVHVQSREEAESVADLLDTCGAIDVDEKVAQLDRAHTRHHNREEQPTSTDEHEQSIPRIQQHLEVGKRTVEQGGVRVRSRIVERPVEEHIRLSEEHVQVERQPVNRPVSDAELRHFQEGDIELIERAEVPVVNKEARVVEEILLKKEVTERDEVIRDSVRNTEVDVDQIDRTNDRQERRDAGSSGPRSL